MNTIETNTTNTGVESPVNNAVAQANAAMPETPVKKIETRGRKQKNPHITKEDYIKALIENNGNEYRTYTYILNIPYTKVARWKNEDPDFKEKVRSIREKAVEYAEEKMWTAIENGSEGMLKFFLQYGSNGKYSAKKEVVVSTNQPVDINAVIDDIKKDLD